ncbi:hypothetical protein [Acidovorax sp. sic0104]|uniref:hypothetical protein n=1 Tax=Acidovorax sp. sic0104 TaxID=2854784 RepID=UPI00403F7264
MVARGASDQSGRMQQRVKAIYRWAVTHQRIDTNPMLDLVPSEILNPAPSNTVPHWQRKSGPSSCASWQPMTGLPASCWACACSW